MKNIKMYEEFNPEVYPEGYLKVSEDEIVPGNILKVDGNKIQIMEVVGVGIGTIVIARYLDGDKKGAVDGISVEKLKPNGD